MNHIMLDLETLGNGSRAALVSIGAVFFDPMTGDTGGSFYAAIELEISIKHGDIDADTLRWWFKRGADAQAVFNDPQRKSLDDALIAFRDFIMEGCPGVIRNGTPKVFVWGNGSTFDNVILANAYRSLGKTAPWPYFGDRDVRTLVGLGRKLLGIDPKVEIPFQGTVHNALDDALHQVRYVSAIYQALAK